MSRNELQGFVVNPPLGDNEALIVNRNYEYVSPKDRELITTSKFGQVMLVLAEPDDLITVTRTIKVDPDLGW